MSTRVNKKEWVVIETYYSKNYPKSSSRLGRQLIVGSKVSLQWLLEHRYMLEMHKPTSLKRWIEARVVMQKPHDPSCTIILMEKLHESVKED